MVDVCGRYIELVHRAYQLETGQDSTRILGSTRLMNWKSGMLVSDVGHGLCDDSNNMYIYIHSYICTVYIYIHMYLYVYITLTYIN